MRGAVFCVILWSCCVTPAAAQEYEPGVPVLIVGQGPSPCDLGEIGSVFVPTDLTGLSVIHRELGFAATPPAPSESRPSRGVGTREVVVVQAASARAAAAALNVTSAFGSLQLLEIHGLATEMLEPFALRQCVGARFDGSPVLVRDVWTIMFLSTVFVDGVWVARAAPEALYFSPSVVFNSPLGDVYAQHGTAAPPLQIYPTERIVDPRDPIPVDVAISPPQRRIDSGLRLLEMFGETIRHEIDLQFEWAMVDFDGAAAPVVVPIASGTARVDASTEFRLTLFCQGICLLLIE